MPTYAVYSLFMLCVIIDALVAGTFCVVVYQICRKLYWRISWSFYDGEETFPKLFQQLAILGFGVLQMTHMVCRFSPLQFTHTPFGLLVLIPF